VAETSEQKAALVAQQKERGTLLAQLEGQIAAQRAEANKLGRDDQRLSRLITDLDAAIVKQAEEARKAEEARRRAEEARKAEEARRAEEARKKAEADRRAEEARKKAEADRKAAADKATADNARRDRNAREAREAAEAREQVEAASRQGRGPVVVADPDAAGLRPADTRHPRLTGPAETPPATKPADPPKKTEPVEEEAAPTRSASTQQTPRAAPVGGGNGLRHGLAAPVRGQVQGRFGVDRPDGGVWRGVVLRAAEGTPVKVVAPGTVVYADWLRGFGNLIIVDHGQQYLTVYAYNQSLLKRVGDSVAAGDTIATVGATGGQVESGLYFEIRHRGAPVDPAQWLAQ